jgi:hypothetical protein
MWWTVLANGIRCARMGDVVNSPTEVPSTMQKFITHNTNNKIATVGLGLAKNSFSLHGFDDAGKTVWPQVCPINPCLIC